MLQSTNTNWELINRSVLDMIAVSTAGVKPMDSRRHINILASIALLVSKNCDYVI